MKFPGPTRRRETEPLAKPQRHRALPNLSISGFGSDLTYGVIDLLNGVGGYTTPGQAFAALTPDGSGGSKLSLGSDGSIDILNVAPTALHAGNFHIG